MSEGFIWFAQKSLKRFHADRALSDWASAFHLERMAEILSEFEIKLAASTTWADGWSALNTFTKRLGEIKNEYEQQRHAVEARHFMAEIQDQYALF